MASRRAQRRKACGHKVRHATEADALAALRALTKEKGFQGKMLTYRCQFCGGFHFGHPPAKIRQALGARA